MALTDSVRAENRPDLTAAQMLTKEMRRRQATPELMLLYLHIRNQPEEEEGPGLTNAREVIKADPK